MKYFIDFEATQYTHEIISVGCVREDGIIFYSLVGVKRNHMSNFITKLTGITKDDVVNAPSSNEVFQKFYLWIRDDSNPEFLCYGDADAEFIKTNLLRTTNPQAAAALGIISTHLIDYSVNVKTYFGLHKAIALRKLIAYYRGVDSIEQAHNALEDSLYLKEVYDHMIIEEPNEDAFPDYKIDEVAVAVPKAKIKSQPQAKPKSKKKAVAALMQADREFLPIVRYKQNNNEEKVYDNLYEAVMRCIKRLRQKNSSIEPDNNILYPEVRKQILTALLYNTKYCKYYWAITDEKNVERILSLTKDIRKD